MMNLFENVFLLVMLTVMLLTFARIFAWMIVSFINTITKDKFDVLVKFEDKVWP